MTDLFLQEHAVEYAKSRKITLDLKNPLGHGTDGSVWKSNRRTAVKALLRQDNYMMEKQCYQKFRAKGVTQLQGFAIPELIAFDDALMVIEMRIVTAPCILDFAKVKFNRPPEFDPETLAETERLNEERFGSEYWPRVSTLLYVLKSEFGIYYQDPKPGNIMFKDWPLD